jgi:hypothetical protein
MQPEKTTTSNAVNWWCNAWACVCFGFMIGFGACAIMIEGAYAPLSVRMTFQALVIPLSFLAMALPRAIVEIARLIRRHRRLAA